jgi:hypothetical protein
MQTRSDSRRVLVAVWRSVLLTNSEFEIWSLAGWPRLACIVPEALGMGRRKRGILCCELLLQTARAQSNPPSLEGLGSDI